MKYLLCLPEILKVTTWNLSIEIVTLLAQISVSSTDLKWIWIPHSLFRDSGQIKPLQLVGQARTGSHCLALIRHRKKPRYSKLNPVKCSTSKLMTCLRNKCLLTFQWNSMTTSVAGVQKLWNNLWHDSEWIWLQMKNNVSKPCHDWSPPPPLQILEQLWLLFLQIA